MPVIFTKANTDASPTKVADASQIQARGGRYGEVYVKPVTQGLYSICEEGNYFKATTTIGTAIAPTGATQTAWTATTPTFIIRNTDAAAGKFLFFDYLRISWVTAPTASTSVQAAAILDNANRVSAGGSALTAVNAHLTSATASIANVTAGAITATAASAPRNLARMNLKTAIPVVGESMVLNFGAGDSGGTSSALSASVGPTILGPGANHSLLIYLWSPAMSAAGTVEYEAGWWER